MRFNSVYNNIYIYIYVCIHITIKYLFCKIRITNLYRMYSFPKRIINRHIYLLFLPWVSNVSKPGKCNVVSAVWDVRIFKLMKTYIFHEYSYHIPLLISPFTSFKRISASDSIWLYLTLGFAENKQKQIMSVIHVPNLEWLWWLATIFKAIPSYPWLPSGKLTVCSWMCGHWNSWSTQL